MPLPTIYNNDKITINTVSAPCGAGKTYALCKYIKQHQNNKNHLIILPSLVLMQQYRQELKAAGVQMHMVTDISHKTVVKGAVTSSITTYFKSCMDAGHVLLITWQAYSFLSYFEHKDNWVIFIDELPQVDSMLTVNISHNKQLVTDFFDVSYTVNSDICTVAVKDGSRHSLQQAHDSNDDGYKSFKALYSAVLSDNKDVFVNSKQWATVTDKHTAKSAANSLDFIVMLHPNQFRNVTLLAANIEQSILYKWFERFHKVTFTPHKAITDNLRYIKHSKETSMRIDVHYFFDDIYYSKNLRDKFIGDNEIVGKKMDDLASDVLADTDFLYVVNKNYDFSSQSNAFNLPVKAHGLNDYKNFTAIYFNLALNICMSFRFFLTVSVTGWSNKNTWQAKFSFWQKRDVATP